MYQTIKKRFTSMVLAFVLLITTLALPSSADSSADENGDEFLISTFQMIHLSYLTLRWRIKTLPPLNPYWNRSEYPPK